MAEQTLRSSIGRSELWLCQMLFAPAAAARLFLVAHIECDNITPCSVLVEGRATVAAAVQPWLCQWLHICSARATLFVRCRLVLSVVCPAVLRCPLACSLWLLPTLTAERPASCRHIPEISVIRTVSGWQNRVSHLNLCHCCRFLKK